MIIYWDLSLIWSLETCLRMFHCSKLSYILSGHAEGQGRNQRGNWWKFDLRWAVWVQAARYEWIRCVPVSYSLYFYQDCVCVCVCVCVCTGFHTCVLISVIIDCPNPQFVFLWLYLCAACVLKVNAAQLINIDKAHLAICRMLWKQQWGHFVISTLVFHLSE